MKYTSIFILYFESNGSEMTKLKKREMSEDLEMIQETKVINYKVFHN